MDPNILLTQTVQKGGCAAKLPAGSLRDVLNHLDLQRPENLIVGTEKMDDACVWDLHTDQYLVQTLDFFTPIVDDAFDFGQIAAANAISDIYAMGATPQIALSILAFPSQTLPASILSEVMAGAVQTVHEAGACLAGGHTIDDDTLKFGLSVSGFVARDKLWTNRGAKVGDSLILTKALGTGTLTTALKRRELTDIAPAIASMKQLNRVPERLDRIDVHAATDITGFGLAGHAMQMARASEVGFEIETSALPILPQAAMCLERQLLNRAHKTNLSYVEGSADFSEVSEILRWLCVDPQTSGGLLLSVPPEQADMAVRILRPHFVATSVIGRVVEQQNLTLLFRK